MLEANAPDYAIRLVGVQQKRAGILSLRLQVMLRNGEWHTLKAWECYGGRPDAGQLEDVMATLGSEASQGLVGAFGIQSVLAT